MAAALFTGAGVALVTLFDDDGRLLVEETVEHAVDLVERGITAVVVSGTTGESWALDVDERLELCAAAAEALDGRAPVIVGSGHLDDDRAARLVGAAADAGAAAVLALSPPHDRRRAPALRGARRPRRRPGAAGLPLPGGLAARHPGRGAAPSCRSSG